MFCDGVRENLRRKKATTYLLCKNISAYMENVAKHKAGWEDRTAHARQSINHNTQLLGDDIEMTVSHGVEYGRYLEKGTRPHDIKRTSVKNKEYIIHHPGTKPYQPLKLAAIQGKYRINNSLVRLWEE